MSSERDDAVETGEDPAQRFVSGSVVRRRSLTRSEFLTEFRGRLPVVHEQGASSSPALRRWDSAYLVAEAGDATLELLAGVYEPDARENGYTRARQLTTTLRTLIESLHAGEERQGYLFNTHTGVFRVNAEEGELRVGWGERANPGLARLVPDFELPAFMDPKDLIYAALLLGGPRHRSPLHYDLSGEVKTIVQVRGRKRVLLFPPSQIGYLSFPCWFESSSAPYRVPHVADVDLHRPDFARFPDLGHARCLEAVLSPGDILYWPSYWPHDVTNLDPFTLAVTCSFEELHASSMWFREQLGLLGRLFLSELHQGDSALGPEARIEQALLRLQRRLFSDELRELTTMWAWHNAIRHPREDDQPT